LGLCGPPLTVTLSSPTCAPLVDSAVSTPQSPHETAVDCTGEGSNSDTAQHMGVGSGDKDYTGWRSIAPGLPGTPDPCMNHHGKRLPTRCILGIVTVTR
jgi:hypothetical protein